MTGTKELALYIVRQHDSNPQIQAVCRATPEPLRAMVYLGLGAAVAYAIDGTELYAEIVDHLEVLC